MKQTLKQRGFTLVEIAIVLVIIGLLLGGILKGQEMITQAKIKNVVADFSGISAAYYGYQDRYRSIPGDDTQAATRWTTPTAAVAGDGNGIVAGQYNAACATAADESCQWWDHLRRAGFVAGTDWQWRYAHACRGTWRFWRFDHLLRRTARQDCNCGGHANG
jgi:prepilin-type N-terminal cleavage/methylation domain-containing protein